MFRIYSGTRIWQRRRRHRLRMGPLFERMACVKHSFHADWPTRSLYHLMINTAVGDENLIATILNGMQVLEINPVEAASEGVS